MSCRVGGISLASPGAARCHLLRNFFVLTIDNFTVVGNRATMSYEVELGAELSAS
jgi:hypothetical protein